MTETAARLALAVDLPARALFKSIGRASNARQKSLQ